MCLVHRDPIQSIIGADLQTPLMCQYGKLYAALVLMRSPVMGSSSLCAVTLALCVLCAHGDTFLRFATDVSRVDVLEDTPQPLAPLSFAYDGLLDEDRVHLTIAVEYGHVTLDGSDRTFPVAATTCPSAPKSAIDAARNISVLSAIQSIAMTQQMLAALVFHPENDYENDGACGTRSYRPTLVRIWLQVAALTTWNLDSSQCSHLLDELIPADTATIAQHAVRVSVHAMNDAPVIDVNSTAIIVDAGSCSKLGLLGTRLHDPDACSSTAGKNEQQLTLRACPPGDFEGYHRLHITTDHGNIQIDYRTALMGGVRMPNISYDPLAQRHTMKSVTLEGTLTKLNAYVPEIMYCSPSTETLMINGSDRIQFELSDNGICGKLEMGSSLSDSTQALSPLRAMKTVSVEVQLPRNLGELTAREGGSFIIAGHANRSLSTPVNYTPGTIDQVQASITIAHTNGGIDDDNRSNVAVGIEASSSLILTEQVLPDNRGEAFVQTLTAALVRGASESDTNERRLLQVSTDFRKEIQIVSVRLDAGEIITQADVIVSFTTSSASESTITSSVTLSLVPSITTTAAIEQELEKLTNAGRVRVQEYAVATSHSMSWAITFDSLAQTSDDGIPLLSAVIDAFPGTWSGLGDRVVVHRKQASSIHPHIVRLSQAHTEGGSTLTTGEFVLRIVSPSTMRGVTGKLRFDASALQIKTALETTFTELDRVEVTGLKTSTMVTAWDITFVTDTFLEADDKIELAVMWNHGESQAFGPSYCASCAVFSHAVEAPGTEMNRMAIRDIDLGSIAIRGMISASIFVTNDGDYLGGERYSIAIPMNASNASIAQLLHDNLPARVGLGVEIISFACDDPQLSCSWQLSILSSSISEGRLNFDPAKAIGSGLRSSTLDGFSRPMVRLASTHPKWLSTRSVMIPVPPREAELRRLLVSLTNVDVDVTCWDDNLFRQRRCRILYVPHTQHIPTSTDTAMPPNRTVMPSVFIEDNHVATATIALSDVTKFHEETTETTLKTTRRGGINIVFRQGDKGQSFMFARKICRLQRDCVQMISTDLYQDTPENVIFRALHGLVQHSEVNSSLPSLFRHTNGTWTEWQIGNLPVSLVVGLEIRFDGPEGDGPILRRLLFPSGRTRSTIYVRGSASEIGRVLESVVTYSLGVDRLQFVTLKIAVSAVGESIQARNEIQSAAVITSLQQLTLEVDVVVNSYLHTIRLHAPNSIRGGSVGEIPLVNMSARAEAVSLVDARPFGFETWGKDTVSFLDSWYGERMMFPPSSLILTATSKKLRLRYHEALRIGPSALRDAPNSNRIELFGPIGLLNVALESIFIDGGFDNRGYATHSSGEYGDFEIAHQQFTLEFLYTITPYPRRWVYSLASTASVSGEFAGSYVLGIDIPEGSYGNNQISTKGVIACQTSSIDMGTTAEIVRNKILSMACTDSDEVSILRREIQVIRVQILYPSGLDDIGVEAFKLSVQYVASTTAELSITATADDIRGSLAVLTGDSAIEVSRSGSGNGGDHRIVDWRVTFGALGPAATLLSVSAIPLVGEYASPPFDVTSFIDQKGIATADLSILLFFPSLSLTAQQVTTASDGNIYALELDAWYTEEGKLPPLKLISSSVADTTTNGAITITVKPYDITLIEKEVNNSSFQLRVQDSMTTALAGLPTANDIIFALRNLSIKGLDVISVQNINDVTCPDLTAKTSVKWMIIVSYPHLLDIEVVGRENLSRSISIVCSRVDDGFDAISFRDDILLTLSFPSTDLMTNPRDIIDQAIVPVILSGEVTPPTLSFPRRMRQIGSGGIIEIEGLTLEGNGGVPIYLTITATQGGVRFAPAVVDSLRRIDTVGVAVDQGSLFQATFTMNDTLANVAHMLRSTRMIYKHDSNMSPTNDISWNVDALVNLTWSWGHETSGVLKKMSDTIRVEIIRPLQPPHIQLAMDAVRVVDTNHDTRVRGVSLIFPRYMPGDEFSILEQRAWSITPLHVDYVIDIQVRAGTLSIDPPIYEFLVDSTAIVSTRNRGLSVFGSAEQINLALSALRYRVANTSVEADQMKFDLSVATEDSSPSKTATLDIIVLTPLQTAEVLWRGNAMLGDAAHLYVNEDTSISFADFTIRIPNVAENESLSLNVTISCEHGGFSSWDVANISVSDGGSAPAVSSTPYGQIILHDGLVLLSGTIDALHGQFKTLSYHPEMDYNGPDTIAISTRQAMKQPIMHRKRIVEEGTARLYVFLAAVEDDIRVSWGGTNASISDVVFQSCCVTVALPAISIIDPDAHAITKGAFFNEEVLLRAHVTTSTTVILHRNAHSIYLEKLSEEVRTFNQELTLEGRAQDLMSLLLDVHLQINPAILRLYRGDISGSVNVSVAKVHASNNSVYSGHHIQLNVLYTLQDSDLANLPHIISTKESFIKFDEDVEQYLGDSLVIDYVAAAAMIAVHPGLVKLSTLHGHAVFQPRALSGSIIKQATNLSTEHHERLVRTTTDLREAITGIYYYPLRDFHGHDEVNISIDGQPLGEVKLLITPVNDQPTIEIVGQDLVGKEDNVTARRHFFRSFVPSIRVSDADRDEILHVRLTVANATLAVDETDRRWYADDNAFGATWIEWPTATPSTIHLHGLAARLNVILAQDLVEVVPGTISNGSQFVQLKCCISDIAERWICQESNIYFPHIGSVFHLPYDERNAIIAGRATSISRIIRLNDSQIDSDATAILRLSSRSCQLYPSHSADILAAPCGDSFEMFPIQGDQTPVPAVYRVLAGSWSCLTAIIETVMYQCVEYPSSGVDTIKAELFAPDTNRLLVQKSTTMKVLKPESPFQIKYVPISGLAQEQVWQWETGGDSFLSIASVVTITIIARHTNDTVVSDDGRNRLEEDHRTVMELHASCSSCMLSYAGAVVPGASYAFATPTPSSSLTFLGTRKVLNAVIQTLQVRSATPSGRSSSGQAQLNFELSNGALGSVLGNSLHTGEIDQPWSDTASVPFSFKLIDAPLRWQVENADLEAEVEEGTASSELVLSDVRIAGLHQRSGDDADHKIAIRIGCERVASTSPLLRAMVSIRHPSIRLKDQPCLTENSSSVVSTEWVEFVTTQRVANAVLKTIRLKLSGIPPARHIGESYLHVLLLFGDPSDSDSFGEVATITVRIRPRSILPGDYLRQLRTNHDEIRLSVQEEEVKALLTGHDLWISESSESDVSDELYHISATVARGTLDLHEFVGGVHLIESGHFTPQHGGRLEMEGTLDDLQSALHYVSYQSSANFEGDDSLLVTLYPADDDADTMRADINQGFSLVAPSQRTNWQFAITVQGVNDPPVIYVRRGPSQTESNELLAASLHSVISFTISDIDTIPSLPTDLATQLNQSVETEGAINSVSSIMHVRLEATMGAFFWPTQHEDIVVKEMVAYRLLDENGTRANREEVNILQLLVFEATISSCNRMLDQLMFRPHGGMRTCSAYSDLVCDEAEPALQIQVSDMAHGRTDWVEQVTTEIVDMAPGCTEEESRLQIFLPDDHAHFNPHHRVVSVHGLSFSSQQLLSTPLTDSTVLQVSGTTGLMVDLEVQRIMLIPPHNIQRLTISIQANDVRGITGTFELKSTATNGSEVVVHVYGDAVAMRTDEILGEINNGAGPGESMEARLTTLTTSVMGITALPRLHVAKVTSNTSDRRVWQVDVPILSTPTSSQATVIPEIQLGAIGGLVGADGIQMAIELNRPLNVDGVFQLQLGEEITPPISVHGGALHIQWALETLQAVDAVKVMPIDTQSGASTYAKGWEITFLSPSIRVPLLQGVDSSTLFPLAVFSDSPEPTEAARAVSVHTERVMQGHGEGSLYEIVLGGSRRDPVFQIETKATTSRLRGSFALHFLDTTTQEPMITVEDIAVEAVAMTSDESISHHFGAREGESMQAKLLTAIRQLSCEIQDPFCVSRRPIDGDHIQIHVTRTTLSSSLGSYRWLVTFVSVPAAFPLLAVDATNSAITLQGADPDLDQSLSVIQIQAPTELEGTFTLAFNGAWTSPIAVDATAAVIQMALLKLPTVYDPSFSFGRVLVRRRRADHTVGNAWGFAVLFVEEIVGGNAHSNYSFPMLVAAGGNLKGLGAYVRVNTISSRVSHGRYEFPVFAALDTRTTRGMALMDTDQNIGDEDDTPHHTEGWYGAVHGEFAADSFSFRGYASDIAALSRQFAYYPPSGWSGYVRFLFRSSPPDLAKQEAMSSTASVVTSASLNIPYMQPKIVIAFQMTRGQTTSRRQEDEFSMDIRVIRGASARLRSRDGYPMSVAVAASAMRDPTLWIHVQLVCEEGQLSIGTSANEIRAGDPQSGLIWINGTILMVNTRLAQLRYSTEANSTHTIDIVQTEVFLQPAAVSIGTTTWVLHLEEPHVSPLLTIDGSEQDPTTTDQWPIVQRSVSGDDRVMLHGMRVSDSSGLRAAALVQRDNWVTLTIHSLFGQVSFLPSHLQLDVVQQPVNPVQKSPGNAGFNLKVRGALNELNRALAGLQYHSARDIDHERDLITLHVYRDKERAPHRMHTRVLQLDIQRVVEIPRIVASSIAYAGYEDIGYQFPDLHLEVSAPRRKAIGTQSIDLNTTYRNSRTTQLWSAQILPSLTKSAFPRGQDEDNRHRWVYEFLRKNALGTDRAVLTASSFPAIETVDRVPSVFFFAGGDQLYGDELWVSDGTTVGTRLFADLLPGPDSSAPSEIMSFSLNGRSMLLFSANGIDTTWVMPFTQSSNKQGEACTNHQRSSSLNDDVRYIVAQGNVWDPIQIFDCPIGWHWGSSTETERHLLDGSAQHHSARDLNEPYVFWNHCEWSGYEYGGVTRRHFRFADSASTGALKHAGRRDSFPIEYSFATSEFAGIVCIRSSTRKFDSSSTPAGRELWVSTGTPESTRRLRDICPGGSSSDPRYFTLFRAGNDWILFQARTERTGIELFKTDGTTGNTVLVEDIWRGPRSSDPGFLVQWRAGDNRLYFAATTDFGRELWATDGSSSVTEERARRLAANGVNTVGTQLIRDICVGGQSSEPRFLTPLDAIGVFFSADDCVHGRELWVSDGTRGGTKLVVDLNTDHRSGGSNPSYLVAFEHKLYFQAFADASVGRELYVSDGSAVGTSLLVDLAPGSVSSSPSLLTVAPNTGLFFFHAIDFSGAGKLWKSDGTPQGTTAVLDTNFARTHTIHKQTVAKTRHVQDASIFMHNNELYFAASLSSPRLGLPHYADSIVPATTDITDPDQGLEFKVGIQVNIGTLRVLSTTHAQQASAAPSSLSLVGTVNRLRDLLTRLVYYPPLNWNKQSTPGHHVVHWQFSVSLEGDANSTSTDTRVEETTAVLIIHPKQDMPVVLVDDAVLDATHSSGDFLSPLRLSCTPIRVEEDIPLLLQGISVRSVDDSRDGKVLWLLGLTVMHGTLQLTRNDAQSDRYGGRVTGSSCVHRFVNVESDKSIQLQATMACINRVLSACTYQSDPNWSGIDKLVVRVSSLPDHYNDDATVVSDEVIIPLHVQEVNDAPYLEMVRANAVATNGKDRYYQALEDTPLRMQGLRVVDPDIPADGVVIVDMRVTHGTLALLSTKGLTMIGNADDRIAVTLHQPSGRVQFSGFLRDVNAALDGVVYTSALNWNSHISPLRNATDDGFDHVAVQLRDKEITNSTTTCVLDVLVLPVVDAVQISRPVVVATSVYASDSLDGVLRGDEDTWLELRELQFTSVDLNGGKTGASIDEVEANVALDVRLAVSHGRLDVRSLEGVRSDTNEPESEWRLRGRFRYVNRAVAMLRYLPQTNYHGHDALQITATTSPSPFSAFPSASEDTPMTVVSVPIEIFPVNDEPKWVLPSPTFPIAVEHGQPTLIRGVHLEDVDVSSVDCIAMGLDCVLEVVVEAVSGSFTFPRLSDSTVLAEAPFSVTAPDNWQEQLQRQQQQQQLDPMPPRASDPRSTTYLVLSGTLQQLNAVLDEIVFELAPPAYFRADATDRQRIALSFTADDRGTYGSGGPRVVSRYLLLTMGSFPSVRDLPTCTILVPARVLEMDEDSSLEFIWHEETLNEDTAIRIEHIDMTVDASSIAARSVQQQYELAMECQHGHLQLSRSGVVITHEAEHRLVIHGFLLQINAALNGSAYLPDRDWYGQDEITMTLTAMNNANTLSTASVFVFVSPVCDDPTWRQTERVAHRGEGMYLVAPLVVQEDSHVLIEKIALADRDRDKTLGRGDDTGGRVVSVSIGAPHGGVMLVTIKGLTITQEAYPLERFRMAPYTAHDQEILEARLFFTRATLTGRIRDLNDAFAGMIYRPDRDYHSRGQIEEVIRLYILPSCQMDGNGDTTVMVDSEAVGAVKSESTLLTIYGRVIAVADDLTLISPLFTRIPAHISLATLNELDTILQPSLEAWEDQPRAIDPVEIYDTDSLDAADDRHVSVRIACRDCTLLVSTGLDALQRDHHVIVAMDSITNKLYDGDQYGDDADGQASPWSSRWQAISYYGSLSAINKGLLSQLTFMGGKDFNGRAIVLVRIVSYGDGAGMSQGQQGSGTSTTSSTVAFALIVNVKQVEDGPVIAVPPLGTLEPTLEVEERGSVLIRGAPSLLGHRRALRERFRKPARQPCPQWPPEPRQLVRVVLSAHDASTRVQYLQFENAQIPSDSAFIAPLPGSQGIVFTAYTSLTGHELWTSDGSRSGTRLLADLAPGHASSRPAFMTPFPVAEGGDGFVYFAAEGPHASWRIPLEHRDQCGGARRSAFARDTIFVVGETTTWDVHEVYDCPVGYRWMSTAEAHARFLGHIATEGHRNEPFVYYAQCGWTGYEWGGARRVSFRFSDSAATGAFKHAGHRDSFRPDVGFQTNEFAGIVCLQLDQNAGYDANGFTGLGPLTFGRQLWRTDGTPEHTTRVLWLSENASPSHLVVFRSRLYFQATSQAHGAELWASDGSRVGTQLIADMDSGIASSSPQELTVVSSVTIGRTGQDLSSTQEDGSLLFFSATTSMLGRELWVSDGKRRDDYEQVRHGATNTGAFVPVGTRLVRDIHIGQGSSSPRFLVALETAEYGGWLFFQADDGVHGRELWRSDGTAGGTVLVMDIRKGIVGSAVAYLVVFQGRVYFQADDGVHGCELWSSDGTSDGTAMLLQLRAGAGSSRPRMLSVLSLERSARSSPAEPAVASLVFAAQTGDREGGQATELWRSDGTAEGTERVFAGSREIVALDLEDDEGQGEDGLVGDRFVSLNRESFLFVGRRAQREPVPVTQNAGATSERYLSRSITLWDVDEQMTNFEFDSDSDLNPQAEANSGLGRVQTEYTVVLSCREGRVSLPQWQQCKHRIHWVRGGEADGYDTTSDQSVGSRSLQLRGSLAALNCAVSQLVYHASDIVHETIWDELVVTLARHESDNSRYAPGVVTDDLSQQQHQLERQLSFETTQRIAVHVVALNDAPVVTMPTMTWAPLYRWTALQNLHVSDEDAGDEALIFTRVSAAIGRVRVGTLEENEETDVAYLTRKEDATSNQGVVLLEIAAPVRVLDRVLQRLEYGCFDETRCEQRLQDLLTLFVDDNGFTGEGGAQVTQRSMTIELVPDD